jgi:hypothetical protein
MVSGKSGEQVSRMSDADCFSLRCGVVHKGNLGLKGSEFSRVIFSLPNSQRIIMHNNIMNDTLQFDAVQFCHEIIAAVRAWYKTHAGDENVQKNLPNVIQLRPQGLAPYIVGLPIIA